MLPVLVVLFVVVPLVELWIVVQVGQAIGVLDTVALLLLDAALGAWLVRREARRAWAALRTAMSSGRVPAHEAGDAVVVAVGGAFLLAPGFLTDLLGLVCVLPATRPWARRLLWRAVLGRLVLGRRG